MGFRRYGKAVRSLVRRWGILVLVEVGEVWRNLELSGIGKACFAGVRDDMRTVPAHPRTTSHRHPSLPPSWLPFHLGLSTTSQH
jgi:hypothetical protein